MTRDKVIDCLPDYFCKLHELVNVLVQVAVHIMYKWLTVYIRYVNFVLQNCKSNQIIKAGCHMLLICNVLKCKKNKI